MDAQGIHDTDEQSRLERARSRRRWLSALVVLLWFLCVLSILGVVCFFCWLLIGVSRFP